MAVATGTALLLAAAGSAGMQLWGANRAASGANRAAEQQVGAADRGLALQQQIYNEQRAGMQPYAEAGRNALGSLGALMGMPALTPQQPAGPAGAVAMPLANTPGNWGTSNPPMNMSDPRVQHLARGGSLADPEVRGTLGAAVGQSSYAQPAQGGSMTTQPKMITVLDPDGIPGQIPEAMWPKAQAAGGKRVG